MSGFDIAEIYGNSQQRLLALAPTLTAEQLATIVPACPAWSVQDTYAHLSGLAADALGGKTGWIGSADNTARQVASRRDADIATICSEWQASGPAMAAHLAANGVNALAIDAWTHDQDIHNALGLISGRESPGLELTIASVWRLKRHFRDQAIPALRIVTGDHDWLVGDDAAATTLHIAPYELARACLGRRSRAQMLDYTWTGNPEPYIDLLPVFEPPAGEIIE